MCAQKPKSNLYIQITKFNFKKKKKMGLPIGGRPHHYAYTPLNLANLFFVVFTTLGTICKPPLYIPESNLCPSLKWQKKKTFRK